MVFYFEGVTYSDVGRYSERDLGCYVFLTYVSLSRLFAQVFAALWYKAKGSLSSNVNREDPDFAFCDDMLCKVTTIHGRG